MFAIERLFEFQSIRIENRTPGGVLLVKIALADHL